MISYFSEELDKVLLFCLRIVYWKVTRLFVDEVVVLILIVNRASSSEEPGSPNSLGPIIWRPG